MTDRNANWAHNLLHRDAPGPSRAEPAPGRRPDAPGATRGEPAPAPRALAVTADKQALAKALLAQRLKKRSRFSDAEKAAIFGRFLQGENPDEIGAKFGVSGMAIRKLVDDAIVEGGLEPPKRAKRKPKAAP